MQTRPLANKPALDNLKSQGWEVNISHWRRPNKGMFKAKLVRDKDYRDSLGNLANPSFYWNNEISHFGGATELELIRGEEKIVVRADCYAKDRFCRRTGIKFALDKLEKLCGIKA
jgi:hypothetical protein